MEALLINRDDIMKLTGIGGNIDQSKILPHVKTAQDIHLQPVLGTDLLDKLKALVTAGDLTDVGNEAYNTLVETYITPMLVNFTLVDFLPFLQFEISNGGIQTHTAENSVNASKNEMDAMVQKFKDKGSFYATRLLDYLCSHSSSFPEYKTNTLNDMHGGNDVSFGGWVLGNNRGYDSEKSRKYYL